MARNARNARNTRDTNRSANLAPIITGETGPDWNEADVAKYYAQCGYDYAFGDTIRIALDNLMTVMCMD
jgi:hypothetical protein